jgi:hypothetical protein
VGDLCGEGLSGLMDGRRKGVGGRWRRKDEKNSSDLGDRSFFPRCSFEDDCLAWAPAEQSVGQRQDSKQDLTEL